MASNNASTTAPSSSGASASSKRPSIHTPLKPASVQDLKAKFDPSKSSGGGSGNTGTARSPLSGRKDVQRSSFGKGSTAGNKSSGVSLSSVSSALQSAAQRRIEATSVTSSSSTSSSSSSSISSLSSSSLSSTAKSGSKTSSLSLTTPRPFTASSSSSSLPAAFKTITTTTTTTTKKTGFSKDSCKADDIRGSFEKDSEGRIELPVMHISGDGSEIKVGIKASTSTSLDNRLKKNSEKSNIKIDESKGVGGSKFSNVKSTFEATQNSSGSNSSSPKTSPRGLDKNITDKVGSPPVQRTNRLVAREITIERLDSGVCVTSYKDQPASKTAGGGGSPSKTGAKNSSASGLGNKAPNKVREIKIQNVTTSSSSTDPPENSKEDLPFRQVKLRNAKEQMARQASKDTKDKEQMVRQASKDTEDKKQVERQVPKAKANPKSPSELRPADDLDRKRISRKMSNERFERLKFDFERGIPTEYSPKDEGELDHVTLQQKAREFSSKPKEDDVPITAKKTKEESLFTEGVKVSDFVKQVNKMNPEPDARPKWKAQKRNSQASSAASSDVGGEMCGDGGGLTVAEGYYEGIPGEDLDPSLLEEDYDDEDDIYEQVTATRQEPESTPEPDQDAIDSGKAPGRRLGVYRKQKGDKRRQEEIVSQAKGAEDSDQEVVIHSDGENGWEGGGGGSSSGTDYEDVAQDYQYCGDTHETFSKLPESGAAGTNTKAKNIKHKLKKIFVNKKKKQKGASQPTTAATQPEAAVATDSEGEILEDTDEADSEVVETLSRTSSERSSGRFASKNHQNQPTAIPSTAAENSTTTTKDSSNSTTSTTNMSSNTTTTGTNILITESSSDDAVSPPVLPPGPPGSAPPLPPRSSRNLTQVAENSPPLPPRNATLSGKTTLGVSLDTVIPVSPPGSKRNSHYAGDKKKDRFSFNSQDGSDSGCSLGKLDKLEYIDYDPASAQTLERFEKPECSGKRRKSLFGRRSTASSSSRPMSSASSSSVYMYPDISAFPELKDHDDEDSLYVDLEDEQIYGKASDFYVSKFESEPLYQWYSKDKMIQNIRSTTTHSPGDLSDEEYLELEKEHSDANSVYEDVERLLEKNTSKPTGSGSSSSNLSNSSQEELRKDIGTSDKPQRRSIIEDVFKNGGSLHRALWCQMPEVIKSGLLQKLTDQEKKIQEAMFEIMTSEASYLKSLKILINVFVSAPEFSSDHSDRCVITRRDRTILFSNIGSIKDISSNFLADLEALWQNSIEQKDVCEVIIKHASKNFEPYVRYCRNQAFQDRALTTLKQNYEFSETVKRLEQHPNCQFLPLASFLLLPMQRITRLPLLVDAICHRLEPATPQHTSAKKAFESLTKVAKHCDEAARKIQQAEQMCLLASNLEFKIKEFPIVSASRFLVKQGELTLIKGEGTVRKPLSKLLGSNKEHVYLFLFNDLLLLTKKKGNTYSVRDYCQRNSLHVEAIDNPDKSRHIAPGTATGLSNLLFLAMLANHENKQVELVLACKLESERSRWIDAIMPAQSSTETERIYEVWDCPQLQCIKKYLATQPDELTLEESDVINVTKKLKDGWCLGERIRDGNKGWFLASHTEEINNSHVRARNLRLRYRLMMASEEYSQVELTKDKR